MAEESTQRGAVIWGGGPPGCWDSKQGRPLQEHTDSNSSDQLKSEPQESLHTCIIKDLGASPCSSNAVCPTPHSGNPRV